MKAHCSSVLPTRSIFSRLLLTVVGLLIVYSIFEYLKEHEILHFLYDSAVIGGLLSGSLHALTGSDHLAALLPLIFGKRWMSGCFYGLVWGLGHGFTSSAIGFASYSMKSYLLQNMTLFDMYGFVVDGAVGLTLMIIGIVGYYESQAESSEEKVSEENRSGDMNLETIMEGDTPICEDAELGLRSGNSSTDMEPLDKNSSQAQQSIYYRQLGTAATVFVNGSVMGVSWDGLPSLAPSVVLEGCPLVLFLLFYALGTAATMALAAGLVGETTCWLSRVAKINVTERLASLSSFCAIVIGGLWVLSGLLKGAEHYYHTSPEGDHNSAVFGLLSLSAQNMHDATLVSDPLDSVNNNDNFHEHSYSTEMEVVLSCGSVLAVLGVIVYATQYDLGVLPRYLSHKPTIYKV